MKETYSTSRRVFVVCNYLFLLFAAFICIYPILHLLAVSLSEGWYVEAGKVGIWPVGLTLEPYRFVMEKPEFARSFFISVERVVLGVSINMLLTLLAAYPLSKSKRSFKSRVFYVWFFIITMLFSGGLIPAYMVVSKTGLINSIWALILPGAIPVYHVIILHNFFKELPIEIEESAFMDGAGYWRSLWNVYIPLSKPALATLVLFCVVIHWNAWFDGILYMNSPLKYPLQSYLQTVVIQVDLSNSGQIGSQLSELSAISQRNTRAAKIFVAMIPVLLAYPYLQRYFTHGMVLGSVKG